jgi:hypothetical protein
MIEIEVSRSLIGKSLIIWGEIAGVEPIHIEGQVLNERTGPTKCNSAAIETPQKASSLLDNIRKRRLQGPLDFESSVVHGCTQLDLYVAYHLLWR